MKINVETIPALTDNYCYLVWREGSRIAVVIDPSEAGPLHAALDERNLTAGLILNTHHHHDHVGGNVDLKKRFGCEVWCSAVDVDRVPEASRGLRDAERFTFDGIEFETWAIPGHTQGQVAYLVREAKTLFVGDTLFSMGCGRLFEGTPEQMHASLKRIIGAGGDVRLAIGHEYTLRNAEFAKTVEPSNREIDNRIARATNYGRVVPLGTVTDELKANPFLRTDSVEIRRSVGFESAATDLAVFTKLRELRNSF